MGPNIGPIWAPRGPQHGPKSAFQIDRGSPFFGFDVGRPWQTDLGAIWDPSWGHLGPILGAPGANLGALGANLGPSWVNLGPSWANLGNLGAILGHLGAILGPSWCRLGPSWGHLAPLLAILGPLWGHRFNRPSMRPGGMREAMNKVDL